MDNLTGAVVFFSCCRMTRPISSCTVEDADHPEAIGYIDMLIEALRNPREDSTVADGSVTNAKSSVEAFRHVHSIVVEVLQRSSTRAQLADTFLNPSASGKHCPLHHEVARYCSS